jgi:hypothetical protein
MERRFDGRKCLIKHIGGNTIKDEDDFIAKINVLAAAAFEVNYQILSVPTKYSSKKKMKLLRQACRRHGGKYGHDIYLELKNKGVIHFSEKTGSTIRAMARRVALLNRKGIIFKRKRAGVYEVNWDWVLSIRKDFQMGPSVGLVRPEAEVHSYGWGPISARRVKSKARGMNVLDKQALKEVE